MTWRRDILIKIGSTVGAAAILGAGVWLQQNLVFAGDLDALAGMVGQAVKAELEPVIERQDELESQSQENRVAIRSGRISQLKAAIRDLRIEIAAMEDEKAANPSSWTVRDESLLVEWTEDLSMHSRELNTLLLAIQCEQVPDSCGAIEP